MRRDRAWTETADVQNGLKSSISLHRRKAAPSPQPPVAIALDAACAAGRFQPFLDGRVDAPRGRHIGHTGREPDLRCMRESLVALLDSSHSSTIVSFGVGHQKGCRGTIVGCGCSLSNIACQTNHLNSNGLERAIDDVENLLLFGWRGEENKRFLSRLVSASESLNQIHRLCA